MCLSSNLQNINVAYIIILPRDAVLARYMLSSRVCLSVCHNSQVGVVQRWLNLGSHKERRTIAQGLSFPGVKNLGEIPTRSAPTGTQIEVG